MTRQLSDVSASYENEVTGEVFPTLPGDEVFSGRIDIDNKSNEQWIGLTWSHAISPKISIGVTTNHVSNKQNKGSNIDLHVLSAANEVAVYQYKRSYDYVESGLLWKAGVAGTFGKWLLGMTVKSPILTFSGTGNYTYQEYFSSIPGLNPRPES